MMKNIMCMSKSFLLILFLFIPISGDFLFQGFFNQIQSKKIKPEISG